MLLGLLPVASEHLSLSLVTMKDFGYFGERSISRRRSFSYCTSETSFLFSLKVRLLCLCRSLVFTKLPVKIDSWDFWICQTLKIMNQTNQRTRSSQSHMLTCATVTSIQNISTWASEHLTLLVWVTTVLLSLWTVLKSFQVVFCSRPMMWECV